MKTIYSLQIDQSYLEVTGFGSLDSTRPYGRLLNHRAQNAGAFGALDQ